MSHKGNVQRPAMTLTLGIYNAYYNRRLFLRYHLDTIMHVTTHSTCTVHVTVICHTISYKNHVTCRI